MIPIRLLVIAGSSRQGAWSRKLADAAAQMARNDGANVTLLDLRELKLPLYDGDIEAASGVPEGAGTLRAALLSHDALLIVTPEYNGFPTPLLINAFDWLSRLRADAGGISGLAATANKPVALLASSPGLLGGLRSMNYLRQYLQMAFAMIVVPQQFALPRAHEAFDDTGLLKDAKAAQAVGGVVTSLSRLARSLAAAA